MSRGDRREAIFRDDADRESFLETLGQACEKTGWRAHAWCLMGNHFHLVVETPQGNLVAGMKWLLGTFASRFNRRHKQFGHLFSGRYKSLVVDGSGNGYLKKVCDYVHLNPARGSQAQRRFWKDRDCEAIASGNDDDASLDRETTANGHRQPPNALALLGETKEDGGKLKSKLPRTDPFKIVIWIFKQGGADSRERDILWRDDLGIKTCGNGVRRMIGDRCAWENYIKGSGDHLLCINEKLQIPGAKRIWLEVIIKPKAGRFREFGTQRLNISIKELRPVRTHVAHANGAVGRLIFYLEPASDFLLLAGKKGGVAPRVVWQKISFIKGSIVHRKLRDIQIAPNRDLAHPHAFIGMAGAGIRLDRFFIDGCFEMEMRSGTVTAAGSQPQLGSGCDNLV